MLAQEYREVMMRMGRRWRYPGTLFLLLGMLAAAAQTAPSPAGSGKDPNGPAPDPKEIIRHSIEVDQRNWKLEKNYTYQEREVQQKFSGSGELKSTEVKTYDISILYGKPFRRLILINDKPLDEKEQRKQDERLEKFTAKYKEESADDRQKRLAKEEKQHEEQRNFAKEVIDAYDFRLLADEQTDGRAMYVIEATPRPGFQPHSREAKFLSKLRGKIWIDKREYQWVKMEAETIDSISFGLFLFKLDKGSHLQFEQSRINNEIWLPRRAAVSVNGRLLLASEHIQQETTFFNYRKFVTNSRLLPGVVEEQPKPQN